MLKRRALIIFPHDAIGGAERVTRIVGEAALRSGHFDEVTLFVMSRGDTGNLSKLSSLNGANIIFSKSKRQLIGLKDLILICRKNSYDFIFSSFADINAALCVMRRVRWLKTKQLVTRESTMFFERDFGWKTPFVRGLYNLYGSQDKIVCQTESMANSLTQHTKKKYSLITTVIPNPITFEDSVITPDDSGLPFGKKIVWCGRLSHVKAPLRALETLSILHDRGYKDLKLIMIGEGPLRRDLEAMIRERELEDHVVLIGFHPRPIAVMRACQVGLITSDVEGFPNVILEMLSAGVKGIVSTNCAGGLDQIPSLILSKNKTVDELASNIIKAFNQDGFYSEIKKFLMCRHPQKFLQMLME